VLRHHPPAAAGRGRLTFHGVGLGAALAFAFGSGAGWCDDGDSLVVEHSGQFEVPAQAFYYCPDCGHQVVVGSFHSGDGRLCPIEAAGELGLGHLPGSAELTEVVSRERIPRLLFEGINAGAPFGVVIYVAY